MSSDSIYKGFTTQEQRSNGGKNRASNLSPERRREIAIKASHSRNCMKDTPKASHFGKMNFGNIEISCAVLEDGRSVVTENSIFDLLGMSKGGRKIRGGAQMPRFLHANNLQAYIPATLRGGAESFNFIMPQGGFAYGYEAAKVTQILNVYLKARRDNILTPNQMAIAATAEIIMSALGELGLTALIHEAVGYQKNRENDALQKLFTAFIAKELQPYVSKFPDEFFNQMKRMYGLQHIKKTPSFFGHNINRWIYDEISEKLTPELQRLNPITEKGYRKHKHHQLLTKEIGCPILEKQLLKITTLMSVSDTKEQFEELFNRNKEVLHG